MVMSDFVPTILASGKRYHNRIVGRIAYNDDGRITEFIEYADPRRRRAFLDALARTP